MILSSIRDNALALALFALITALLLSSVNNLTRDRIAQAERLAAQSALLEVVPSELHDNDMLLDTQPIPSQFWSLLGLENGGNVHIARYNNEPLQSLFPPLVLRDIVVILLCLLA